jgi:hypothetical protein
VSAGVLRGQAIWALAGGRLLTEVTNPFDLEVHHPLHLDGQRQELPELPTYVPREHDQALAEVVRVAAGGRSGIAVLVGGSSTGKTRACWEALEPLRGRPERWRLWHPIDPSRPEAALREVSSVGPRTVVWLNEAQFYLDVTVDKLGERIAAGLREALRDPARAPVLVLATLWPHHWGALTARPAVGPDPHAQARELLAGRDISVPATFTPGQLRLVPATGDPRLALAAKAAEDGQVVQFLAGAPELTARYRNAPPAAGALINAAMDARRLGMGVSLPLAFLEAAAPGYLTDTDWATLGDDWLEQALSYIAAPAKGIRGPLTRIRPRPADGADPVGGPAYRLADYLEQRGRRDRHALIPPHSFWQAAVCHAAPSDLPALAIEAAARGLFRDAARLHKHAIAHGNTTQAADLLRIWPYRHPHPAASKPAQWAVSHARLGDPGGVASLLRALREAGAGEQATALADRDPAAYAPLSNPHSVASLLKALREAGAGEQATALIGRDPAAHAPLSDPHGVAFLLEVLLAAGADRQVTALADRAVSCVVIDPLDGAMLLSALLAAGAIQQAGMLEDQFPAQGLFIVHRRQPGRWERYRFGQEPDGTPTPSWGWEDLD